MDEKKRIKGARILEYELSIRWRHWNPWMYSGCQNCPTTCLKKVFFHISTITIHSHLVVTPWTGSSLLVYLPLVLDLNSAPARREKNKEGKKHTYVFLKYGSIMKYHQGKKSRLRISGNSLYCFVLFHTSSYFLST